MALLKLILKIIGGLVGIGVIYMLIVMFAPGFSIPYRLPELDKIDVNRTEQRIPRFRKDVTFDIEGTEIHAWLYMPEDVSEKVPCIVMATGLGGTKDMILEAYAIRFRESGFAVLTFDYRFFGKSGGEPRQLIWMPHQLADLEAAVTFVRTLAEINPDKIALWGTSAGGAHVVTAAARDNKIACVSAMVPMLDPGFQSDDKEEDHSVWLSFKMFVHGQRDIARSRFGLAPHRIPIVGKPGTVGLMTTADAYHQFVKLLPKNYTNQACARIILRAMLYRPVDTAQNIQCPVLLQLSETDSLLPLEASKETIRKLGDLADVKTYSAGHFEIYTGQNFKRSVGEQIAFFKKHL